MKLKKSLILVVMLITIFSYAETNELPFKDGCEKCSFKEDTRFVKQVGTNIVYNTKGISQIDKNVLSNICSLDAMSDLGISEKKAEEIRNKLTALELKEIDYYEEINKIGEKQLELLMDDDMHEKEIYKLVDEVGALKIKIAKLRVDAIMLLKKNFTIEQIKKLK